MKSVLKLGVAAALVTGALATVPASAAIGVNSNTGLNAGVGVNDTVGANAGVNAGASVGAGSNRASNAVNNGANSPDGATYGNRDMRTNTSGNTYQRGTYDERSPSMGSMSGSNRASTQIDSRANGQLSNTNLPSGTDGQAGATIRAR